MDSAIATSRLRDDVEEMDSCFFICCQVFFPIAVGPLFMQKHRYILLFLTGVSQVIAISH